MKSFEDIHGITDTLSADADYVNNQLNQHPNNQHLRRTYVRSLFALLEGTCFYWGSMLKDIDRLTPNLFNEEERLKLNGQSKNIKGKITDKRYPTADMISFTLKMLAKSTEGKIDLGRTGWEKLNSSLEVRDRITHPRSNRALEISDEEINNAREALSWYFDMQNPFLKKLLEQGTSIPDYSI